MCRSMSRGFHILQNKVSPSPPPLPPQMGIHAVKRRFPFILHFQKCHLLNPLAIYTCEKGKDEYKNGKWDMHLILGDLVYVC